MGQALYRKYRSKSLDEIVGQEHVTETLRRAITSGRVSHAYLFTGPRGVGKTSIARILAHELNGVPYTGEDTHLDIIEIDAASNGGVEEIRDLRDKVYVSPSTGKYKVYIIDEVHMMTSSAFNALLKTLEEPPAHAIFILATTEAHKLPATIISRTQRFTFKPIEHDKMVKHLKHIAKKEKLAVDDAALELLAERSEGSFRDAISMLDQVSTSAENITRDSVASLLGIPPEQMLHSLVQAIAAHDAGALAAQLTALRTAGYQASGVAKQLGQYIRSQLLANSLALSAATALTLLSRLIDVPASHNADALLEIALLEATLQAEPVRPTTVAIVSPAATAPRLTPVSAQVAQASPTLVPTPAAAETAPLEPTLATDNNFVMDALTWQTVLDSLKKEYNTLYGIIRMAQPTFAPGRVTLTFGFAFHQKRANDPKNKKILMATIDAITGQQLSIDCKFDKAVTPPAPIVTATPPTAPAVETTAALGAINNVFGGGEILNHP